MRTIPKTRRYQALLHRIPRALSSTACSAHASGSLRLVMCIVSLTKAGTARHSCQVYAALGPAHTGAAAIRERCRARRDMETLASTNTSNLHSHVPSNPPTPPAVGVLYLPPRVSNPPTPLAVGVLDPCPHLQAAATLGTSCLGATLLCISFAFSFSGIPYRCRRGSIDLKPFVLS